MARIVLTADRTLMADYELLLEGILGTVSTTYVPESINNTLISPKAQLNGDGEVKKPPYGLRKLEAALVSHGFDQSDIAFPPPDDLHRFRDDCRIISISSGDPLGLGMTSTVMAGLMGEDLYTEIYFRRVVAEANHLKRDHPKIRICCGGPGIWQFMMKKEMISEMGIDHVFVGYGDKTVPEVFEDIMAGKTLPQIIDCEEPDICDIKEILGPSSMGIVEIGRGCGRGCRFCTMRDKPMVHIPKESILSDIRMNLKHGVQNIATLSEDFLRYGANSTRIDEEKVLDLYETISQLSGLRLLQLDHVNIASVASVSESALKRIHDAVSLHRPNGWVWVNAGIETASPRLLRLIAPGKADPFDISDWPGLIREAVQKLNDSGFMPFLSIVLGAPQETEEDVQETQEFLDSIKAMRAVVFPTFYVGVGEGESSFHMEDMDPHHWKLFSDAYEMNFKWVPELFSRNQKDGGVGLKKRFMTQATGSLWTAITRRKIRRLARGVGS